MIDFVKDDLYKSALTHESAASQKPYRTQSVSPGKILIAAVF